MDVKIYFLNGVVEEEVYVEKPLGFKTHDSESHVFRLKKSLYGLRQVPRTWYGRIDNLLSSLGITKSKTDSKLYYKVEEGNPMILLLYVDDLFVTGMDGLISNTCRVRNEGLGYDALFSRHGGVHNANGIFLI